MKERAVFPEIKEPSVEYKDSYLSALKEYHHEGRNLDEKEEDLRNRFSDFVEKLKKESRGENLKQGYVPATTYWLIDEDGYVGRVSLRHELNENLLKVGGHIGYDIRPSKRRRGFGTKALELVLPKARSLGLEKVLITCDSTNIASKKIIESNGGVFESEVSGEKGHPNKLRFWIKL